MVTSKQHLKEHFLFDLSNIPVSLTSKPTMPTGWQNKVAHKLAVGRQNKGRTQVGKKLLPL